MIETSSQIKITKTTNSKLPEVDFSNLSFGKVFGDHMFEATFSNGEWSNLEIKPFQNLSLSPATSVIHYGQSIFEGMKAYRLDNGEIAFFRPEKNMERLNLSADRMGMPHLPMEIFNEALHKLIELDQDWVPQLKGASLYVRPFMFATDEYIGVKSSSTFKFMIFTCPVAGYYSKPVRVKIEEKFSRAIPGGVGEAKAAGNYAASIYPASQGIKEGYDQLIWTDAISHKYIEESGTMNIMFVVDDVVYTPRLTGSILNGITRQSVIELAQKWGVQLVEQDVEVDFVVKAAREGRLQEAFGVGTAATIAQIKLIGFRGEDLELPAVETRTFSNRVAQYFQELKAGKIADDMHWMVPLRTQ